MSYGPCNFFPSNLTVPHQRLLFCLTVLLPHLQIHSVFALWKQTTSNTFHVSVTDINVQVLLPAAFCGLAIYFEKKGCRPGGVHAVQGISGVLGEELVFPLPLWHAQLLALPSEHGLGVDARVQMGDGLGALCSPRLWHKEGEPAKGRC